MTRTRVILFLVLLVSTLLNAASVSGPGVIRVRAGGQASFASGDYTASYGTGDSGDFTWTETGVIPGVTITISRQPPSPFLTARLNVSASASAQPGSYSIIVNAYPATGTVGSRIVNIVVVESLGSITPTSIPDAKETVPMSVQFNVTSGTGNYTWSASGLPSGVSMNPSTGLLSGMPLQGTAGTYNTTINLTDNTDPVVSTSINIRWQVFPAYIPLSNQGQICYVKNIVRDANGVITSTGDLFVKNLQTNVERRVTNYQTATGIIYNPMLTPDGSKILYGYKPNASSNSRLYLVSTQATVSSPNQGLILKNNNQEAIPSTMDARYASISPDYNGNQGLIAFTCEKTDRAELWLYNFFTQQLSQLKSEKYLYIRHPVFLSASTIAFVGVKNDVQDIYIVDTNGTNYRKLTTNSPVSPQYDRIQSSFRNPLLSSPLLIYAKRVYDTNRYAYSDWDIYIGEVDTVAGSLTEYRVTETSDINEFSPAFFGDSTDRDWVTLVRSSGQMFYEADIVPGTRNVWQTNYDTIVPADSNSIKLQRTDSITHTGLANWSPIPAIQQPEAITIENTRLVYSKQSGSYFEIFKSDWSGSGFDTTGTMLTPSFMNADKYNPSLSRNGGLISFTMGSIPTAVFKMNCDGSSLTQLAYQPTLNSDYSTVSPDGTWIVYARKVGPGTYGIFAKRSTSDVTGSESVIVASISASAIDPPCFNPEMTKIVYAKKDPGGYYDIYSVDVNVDTINGSITALSSPVNLTNTPAISERMPSFSNTGTKIIFCSNKELIVDDYEIYTMDISGSGIEKVVSGPGHSWPVYSPVSDPQAGTDIIGYVENGEIWYATLSRVTPPGSPSGQNPVTNATATGITVASGYERFSWGRKRGDGTIIATRTLPYSLAAGMTVTYQISVDVDEAKLPASFILNETFAYGTGGFTDVQAKVDGVNAVSTIYTYPASGLQTLKINFMDGMNGGVRDHIVTITMKTPSSTGTQAFVGNLSYSIDGVPTTVTIGGNGSTSVDKPYMPVDIYDANNMVSPDGVIGDYDLLYAIDAWARDAHLTGYGITWPQNLGNWDTILLGTITGPGIIPIWANSTYMGGYDYNPSGPGASYEMYWEPGTF